MAEVLSKMAYMQAVSNVASACFGYSLDRLEQLKPRRTIAHYTSAETALQIIQSKSFWLRNATLMNDFSELEYGDSCMQWAFADATVRERLNAVVEKHHGGLVDEILSEWNKKKVETKRLTYIGSFAEIDRGDALGRLSMWRAYGGRAGVALCLNPMLLEDDTDDLSVFHSPVLYGPPEKLRDELLNILGRLEAIEPEFSNAERHIVKHYLSNAIKFGVLSFKHPGFEEEQEWRMIYSLDEGASPYLNHKSVSVGGVPQVVCEVPLTNANGLNVPHLEIGNIFDRIVIGPCDYPQQIEMAFLKAFHDHGVPPPAIVRSNIPLRQH